MDPVAMMQERAKHAADAQAITDKAYAEKRGLTALEQEAWDKHFAEVDRLKDMISRAERSAAVRRELDSVPHERTHRHTQPGEAVPAGATGEDRSQDWRKELRSFFREESGRKLVQSEKRALQADSATGGGYAIVPQYASELIRAVDNVVYIRRKSRRKYRLEKTDEIILPTLDRKPTAFAWGTELSRPPRDASMKYGRRILKTKPARGVILVSKKAMRLVDPSPEQQVREEFAALFGQKEEEAFFTGDGAGQPIGLFHQSPLGIPTSRDFSTGNTNALVKFDGLIGVTYELKEQYRANAEWVFHRNTIAQIRKEKDNNGQYLWQQSVALGTPDTILRYPVTESEYCPNTVASGNLMGLFGDLGEYAIADGMDLEVEILDQVFWETQEVGFEFAIELDGAPRQPEAFARVKLA